MKRSTIAEFKNDKRQWRADVASGNVGPYSTADVLRLANRLNESIRHKDEKCILQVCEDQILDVNSPWDHPVVFAVPWKEGPE